MVNFSNVVWPVVGAWVVLGFVVMVLFIGVVNADELDIPLHKQENEVWCGQARAQSILEYYGVNKTQREIALMAGLGRTTWGHWTWLFRLFGLDYTVTTDLSVVQKYAGVYPIMFHDLYYNDWMIVKGIDDVGWWVFQKSSGDFKGDPHRFVAIVVYGGQ